MSRIPIHCIVSEGQGPPLPVFRFQAHEPWTGYVEPGHVEEGHFEEGALDGSVVNLAVTVDQEVAEAARPRTLGASLVPEQSVGFEIIAYGEAFYPQQIIYGRDIVPPITISERLGGGVTFSFGVRSRGYDDGGYGGSGAFIGRPLGGFMPAGQPNRGQAIDIVGIYITDGGIRRVPLVTGGRVENAADTSGDQVLRINGIDQRGAVDRQEIEEYTLAPGKGRWSSTIIRDLAELAGWPGGYALNPGRLILNGLQVRGERWLSIAEELADVDGRYLHVDQYGNLSTPLKAPTVAELGAYWTFGIRDLEEGGLLREADSDAITTLTLESTRIVPADELDEGEGASARAGQKTVHRVVESYSSRSIPSASFRQTGAGTLTALGGVATTGLHLEERTTIDLIYEDGRLIEERTLVEALRNPLTWRYQIDSTGAPTAYNPQCYIFTSGAVGDDGSMAFLWDHDRFGVVERSKIEYEYDDLDRLIRKTREKRGSYLIRHRIKERASTAVTFEAQAYETPAYTLGNGESVGSDPKSEQYATEITERVVEEYTLTDDGFKTAEVKEESRIYARRGGSLFLYGDGQVYEAAQQSLQLDARFVRRWIETGEEGTTRQVDTEYDGRGNLVGGGSRVETVTGFLPEAEFSEASRGIENVEDDDFAGGAAATEKELIEATVTDAYVAAWREPQAARESYSLGQSVSHLENRAARFLREGASMRFTFTTAATNFLLRPGMVVKLLFPELDLFNVRCYIVGRDIEDPDGVSRPTTRFYGEVYQGENN